MDIDIISSAGEENKLGTNISTIPTDLGRFLEALFDPQDIIGLKPIETWTDPVTQQTQSRILYKEIDYGRVAFFTSHPEYWTGLLSLAETEKANLFFTVCPRFGPRNLYERVGARLRWDYAWQIGTVRVLWTDLDNCSIEETHTRCNAAGLPIPSVVVRSGHGVHLYWILETPFFIDDVGAPPGVATEFVTGGVDGKSLTRKYAQTDAGNVYLFLADPETGGDSKTHNPEFIPRSSAKALYFQDMLSGLAAAIQGDHTTDLSRLLRLPGTWNRKNERNGKTPVPCELIECDGSRRYPLTAFARFVSTAPSRKRREQVAQVRLPIGQKITKRFRNRLAELINTSLTAQDRSRADWALMCWSIENGLNKEDIWEEVQSIGKFAERGREYFDLTWDNAEQHVREAVVQRNSSSASTPGSSGLGGDDDGPPGDRSDGSDDQRPKRTPILITPEEYLVNNQAIAALSDPCRTPELFQRGNLLVRVFRDSVPQ
jgi:hypothetical protein